MPSPRRGNPCGRPSTLRSLPPSRRGNPVLTPPLHRTHSSPIPPPEPSPPHAIPRLREESRMPIRDPSSHPSFPRPRLRCSREDGNPSPSPVGATLVVARLRCAPFPPSRRGIPRLREVRCLSGPPLPSVFPAEAGTHPFACRGTLVVPVPSPANSLPP